MRQRDLDCDCRQCAKAPALRKQKHCEPEDATVYVIYRGHERLETNLDRCFTRHRSPETDLIWEMLDGERAYDGGLLQQPAVLCDAARYLNYCLDQAKEAD